MQRTRDGHELPVLSLGLRHANPHRMVGHRNKPGWGVHGLAFAHHLRAKPYEREEADWIPWDAMRDRCVGSLACNIIYAAVRAGGCNGWGALMVDDLQMRGRQARRSDAQICGGDPRSREAPIIGLVSAILLTSVASDAVCGPGRGASNEHFVGGVLGRDRVWGTLEQSGATTTARVWIARDCPLAKDRPRYVVRWASAAASEASVEVDGNSAGARPMETVPIVLPHLEINQYIIRNLDVAHPAQDLVLREALSSLDGKTDDGSCPEAGWDDSSIRAIVVPSDMPKARRWAQKHAFGFDTLVHVLKRIPHEEEDAADIAQELEAARYVVVFTVPQGDGVAALRALREQRWALFPSRDAVGAGPEGAILDFKRDLYRTLQDKPALKAALAQQLRAAFPQVMVRQNDLREGRGLTFHTTLAAPASKLGVRGYEGWWLKANVTFRFSKQAEDTKRPHDRLEIAVDDGWLAKFPEGQTPPKGYGTHLSPDGENKYEDFWSLEALTNELAIRLGRTWKADSTFAG